MPGGHLPAMFDNLPASLPHIQAGKPAVKDKLEKAALVQASRATTSRRKGIGTPVG